MIEAKHNYAVQHEFVDYFGRQESLPTPRRSGIRAIRDLTSHADPAGACCRRRTIPASVSAGMITPVKIPDDKLLARR
jgi:hypothetical protein